MIPLEPERYYHIYNHANGKDVLFMEERNFSFFLEQYKKHISPVAETLAYCLMPNHFHMLVQIKDEESLKDLTTFPKFWTLEKLNIDDREKQISLFISKQFSNMFSSYTQAFNRSQNRKGSLFYKNFRRKLITSEDYMQKLVNYVHFNPVVHGFINTPSEWKYSSYNAILSKKETLINRETVLEYFGGIENFRYCHNSPFNLDGMDF